MEAGGLGAWRMAGGPSRASAPRMLEIWPDSFIYGAGRRRVYALSAAATSRSARRPRRARCRVALLAKDAASLEERGPGLSLRAGSVLLGVALCDQSLKQRAALQRDGSGLPQRY